MRNNLSQPASLSCGVPQGSILEPFLFLIHVNDVSQAVKCDLFLYDDDTSLFCQHKYTDKIENYLNEDFCNICHWFLDNKLSIHFNKLHKLNNILNSSTLGCLLEETMSGEAIAINVVNKINNKLKFLYRENSFLTSALRCSLRNELIQFQFDYVYSV